MRAGTKLGGRSPDGQCAEPAGELFAMPADATRVRILRALGNGPVSVDALAEPVRESPATVSQRLAELRSARIVPAPHQGTRVLRRLGDVRASESKIAAILRAARRLGVPRHHSGGSTP